MSKIYYAPDMSVSWHTIGWIDQDGQMHNDVLQVGYDHPNCPADVCVEFELLHPGAVRVSRKKLNDLFRQIGVERLKLAEWNQMTSEKLYEDEGVWPIPESPYDPDPRDFGGSI